MKNVARLRISVTLLSVLAVLVAVPAYAQNRPYPNDFSGHWVPLFHEDDPDRGPGPALGQYEEMPINDDARARAMTWDASIQGLPEWRCRPHSADYAVRSPQHEQIWAVWDDITREVKEWHIANERDSSDRIIYMDGRPHPGPNAPHTWSGFSTGEWIGDILKVTTTHLKEGYVRRNGVPISDQRTFNDYLIRRDDGYLTWVTIINDPVYLAEPWIWTSEFKLRMVTPRKGDYQTLPLNAEGRKVGDTWDPDKDTAAGLECKSYGAAAVMRVPGRIRITWQNPNTLRIDTEAGTQTRLFHFDASQPPPGEPTWQGHSVARWMIPGRGRQSTTLKAVTTHLRAGYLRKNGVPYSANAAVTEYFNVLSEAVGGPWLIVTNIVDDPQYLTQPFATSTHPHDLSGIWDNNPSSPGTGGINLDSKTIPPMTPYGKQLWEATQAVQTRPEIPAMNGGEGSKDPMLHCDPLGYPRSFTYNYGFEFLQLPNRVIQFFEWGGTHRTIWTDGRKLPADPPQPRWYGYAVGHWEGDTFVVESNGYEEGSWLDQDRRTLQRGMPHSDAMRIVERYKRTAYDTIEVELTVIDPKVYTAPWTTRGKHQLRPGTELWEYLCVPSYSEQYNRELTAGEHDDRRPK